jgi:U1 small nuclear ribonucleoprotein
MFAYPNFSSHINNFTLFLMLLRCANLPDAYKAADGRKICGRRIVVDVERGRTVKNWRPRRLGTNLF